MNLGEIKAHVRIETSRPASVDDQLDDYVNHAIRSMSREDNFRFLRTTGTLSSTTTTRSVNLPARCGSILAIHYHDTTSGGSERTHEVHKATIQEARQMYGEATTGKPHYYIRRAKATASGTESIDLWPLSDEAYLFELEHLQFYADLDNDTASNVISTDYPWAVIKRTNQIVFEAVGDDASGASAGMQYGNAVRRALQQEKSSVAGPSPPLIIDANVIPDKWGPD